MATAHPRVNALVYLIDPTEADVACLDAIVRRSIVEGHWITTTPSMINDISPVGDPTKSDQPLWTLGIMIEVSSASGRWKTQLSNDKDRAELADMELLIGIATDYSRDFKKDWMLVYDDCEVGQIAAGAPDQSIMHGLLQPWRTATES